MTFKLNFQTISPCWLPLIEKGLAQMDSNYLKQLDLDNNWLPGKDKIFNAFSLPLEKTRFILFGESPYPRNESANGYAFWDAAADGLWSEQGLSKRINRATSLRNFIKMLLIAGNYLSAAEVSQESIAKLNKIKLVATIDELFQNFMKNGVLLLNASLVLQHKNKNIDAKAWQPFISSILEQLKTQNKTITLILLGNIAKQINHLDSAGFFQQFNAEHPYNCSFITNPSVIDFFKPFNLLEK